MHEFSLLQYILTKVYKTIICIIIMHFFKSPCFLWKTVLMIETGIGVWESWVHQISGNRISGNRMVRDLNHGT